MRLVIEGNRTPASRTDLPLSKAVARAHHWSDALYRCLRAVHLGCSIDEGTALARSAFQLLHRRYPDSPWAEKGKVWYKGDSCTNS